MKKHDALWDRIRAGETVIGTWTSIPHSMNIEAMAQGGFDFLLFDGEHSPFTTDDLGALLPASELHGCPVIFRVRFNRNEQIKSALDAGVTGIMVPMVNSVEDARYAIASTKYPPAGVRGFGPWRASNYYLDLESYLENANRNSVVMLQIEHIDAVNEVDAIAELPGADVLFVGPADLALSMGLQVGTNDQRLLDALVAVSAAARKHKKAVGIDLTSIALLPTYLSMGFTVFISGADTSYVIDGARGLRRGFSAALAEISGRGGPS